MQYKRRSSGSPILNIKNNKIIGIHKEGSSNKQYNIGLFINEPIKEFIELYKNQLLIQKFNQRFNVNVRDNEISELDLINKNIGDEGLKNLCKINFNKLEILNLSGNNISDINILKIAKFKGLKELNLNNNKISDMKVLENIQFHKLEKLYLGNNEISDINKLEKVNFKELKELYLNNNNISDIKILEKLNFEKLETLSLDNNKIKDFDIINKINIKKKIISINSINNNANFSNGIDYNFQYNIFEVEEEWMAGYINPKNLIQNNMKTENKTNVIFKTTQGKCTNLVIEKDKTISDLLWLYLRRNGLYDSRDVIFLYNATRLREYDKTTIEQFFRSVYPYIIVNDIHDLIGATNKYVEFYLKDH